MPALVDLGFFIAGLFIGTATIVDKRVAIFLMVVALSIILYLLLGAYATTLAVVGYLFALITVWISQNASKAAGGG